MITMEQVRAQLLRNVQQTNALWVALKHKHFSRLRSRRVWADRWRADKLGESRVRARRLRLPVSTPRVL